MPRVGFIGNNSAFSAAHLAAVSRDYNVSIVVEAGAPTSRLKRLFRWVTPSRLQTLARENGSQYLELKNQDNSTLAQVLRAERPDLVVVVGMGWLLDEATLAAPQFGTLNVHAALLPSYRGADPIFWQFYDGVDQSGVTVHLLDPAEDHGPVVRQQVFPVPPGTSLAEFLRLAVATGPPLLLEAIGDLVQGNVKALPQPELSPTRRARRLRPGDRQLVAWEEWSLERTWQVLRGIGPILGWPRPRWRDLGWTPVIADTTAEPSGMQPGQSGRDASGWFLAHPSGKIRFRYHWAPWAWVAAMLRSDRPAGGIIAAERAAWPPLRSVHGARTSSDRLE